MIAPLVTAPAAELALEQQGADSDAAWMAMEEDLELGVDLACHGLERFVHTYDAAEVSWEDRHGAYALTVHDPRVDVARHSLAHPTARPPNQWILAADLRGCWRLHPRPSGDRLPAGHLSRGRIAAVVPPDLVLPFRLQC